MPALLTRNIEGDPKLRNGCADEPLEIVRGG